MNLIDFFERNVQLHPEKAALVFENRSWSYREADALARRIANGLKGFGIERETKCAVLSKNHWLSFVTLLGILKARGTWVPIHTGNAPDDSIYILNFFDVEILFYQKDFENIARRAKAEIPAIRHFICIDGESDFAPNIESWAKEQVDTVLPVPLDPDAMCMLRGTGGTTGRPKAVMNTNRNFMAMIANYCARMRSGPDSVYLAAAPLSHAATMFAFINIAMGGTMVILPKFDALAVLKAIEKHKVTLTYLPPTAIYSLLSHPQVRDFDYSSLRYFIYGAAPIAAAKLEEAIGVFGRVMTQAYGQHEAPAGISFLEPEEHFGDDGKISEKRLLSCGRPQAFTRVALMDDNGNLVGPGEVGEIVVQGDIVMRGYYKNPEATAEISKFGWHHTGDLAYQDESGFIYICDRKKEIIITGGFNVYPLEVEQVILAHPSVQDVAVVGVPDPKWGEAIKAVVERKIGKDVTAEELIAACRERLGPVKAPKSIDFIDSLPRSPAGKVMRRAVRDTYWSGESRRV